MAQQIPDDELPDEEMEDITTGADADGKIVKKRRVQVSQIERALDALRKDFEQYKKISARRGTPVTDDADISDKFARAINAIGAYEWYKQKPLTLPVRQYQEWKK